MKFTISRELLLKPLQLVAGVVERRQTLPVLSNALIRLDGAQLSMTGTDLEVEIVGQVTLEAAGENGEITAPARKLLDICRALPEGELISFNCADDKDKAVISSGRSRFTLSTLPANEFPSVEEQSDTSLQFSIAQQQLKNLINATSFAMAQQDVRYYLNGMLLEVENGKLISVATDGHRLAMSVMAVDIVIPEKIQVVLPRKGVIELSRLLGDEGQVTVVLGGNYLRVIADDFSFTSKLVDGAYPDYQRVLPKGGTNQMTANREMLRQAFSRTAILSNEKYRGVRLGLSEGLLRLNANNPEQEEAQEEIAVDYAGDSLEIGFNVNYVLDVLGALNGENARITLSDANSSALIEDPAGDASATYVVMPMRL